MHPLDSNPKVARQTGTFTAAPAEPLSVRWSHVPDGMNEPAPGDGDFGKPQPKTGVDLPNDRIDRWLFRWLRLLGVMIGLCLWLLAAEKLVFTLTH